MAQKAEAIHKVNEAAPERSKDENDSFFRDTRFLIEEEVKVPPSHRNNLYPHHRRNRKPRYPMK